jgi:hypothetical protein
LRSPEPRSVFKLLIALSFFDKSVRARAVRRVWIIMELAAPAGLMAQQQRKLRAVTESLGVTPS